MKKKVLAQFLKDSSKECKLWAFVSCFVCGLLGVFILANLLAAINGLNIVLPLAIAGVLGQIFGGITTLFDRLAWIKLNWKKPRILAQLACGIFGIFGGAILALTNEDLNWLGWIIHLGIGALIGLLVGLILAFLHKFDWSGFKDKKLWDWMQLLILPILVAAGSFLFSHQIGKREAKQAELRKQQETLKLYYDQMKTYTDRKEVKALLRKLAEIRDKRDFQVIDLDEIEKILSEARPDLETIKSLTFTILEGLDGERKSQVVSYLYDIGLIRLEIPKKLETLNPRELTNSNPIPKSRIASIIRKDCNRLSQNQKNDYVYESAIHLENANLSEIDLKNKDLKYINFCNMRLTDAKLSGTDLSFANINETNLKGADLDRAIFSNTEFDYINVENIAQKYLLTMMVQKNSKILKDAQEVIKEAENNSKRTNHIASRLVESALIGLTNKDEIFINGRFFPKDLSNANLHKLDLSKADLSEFNLENSDLSEANLIEANLSNAKLKNALLDRARIKDIKGLESAEGIDEKLKSVNDILSNKKIPKNLAGKNLSNMNLDGQDLTGADLTDAKLEGASMKGVILKNANLKRAILENTNLTDADLTNANLVKTNLQNSTLVKARLDKAQLVLANLQGANLEEATMYEIDAYATNFDEANMNRVKLNSSDRKKRASLNSCSLGRVDLSDSDLTNAYLIAIDFSGSNLQGAVMKGVDLSNSKFVSVNLRNAKILKPTFKNTEHFDTDFPEGFNSKSYEPLLKKIPPEGLSSILPK